MERERASALTFVGGRSALGENDRELEEFKRVWRFANKGHKFI